LRQEHLERLGWRFHRIWSQDWFFHREAEVARARAAYDAAIAATGAPLASPPEVAPAPATSARVGECPIPTHRSSISDYTMRDLVAVIHWIESDTLLRTEDDLLAETMRVLGFKRRGPNITSAISRAIAQAREPGY
jgi:hypothetical protein